MYASPFAGFTGLGNLLLQSNPETAYQLWQGAYGASPFANQRMYGFTSDAQPWFQNDYYARSARNPGLSWTNYLDDLSASGGGLDALWGGLSPSQRGERPAPQVKWLNDKFNVPG